LNRKTQNTVSAIVALAIFSLCALAYVGPAVKQEELAGAATFGVFAVIVYALPYTLANSAQGTPAFLAQLSSVLLAPSWTTGAVAAVSVAIGELFVRRPPIKAAFNVAQYTLAVCAAIVAYRVTGGTSLLNQGPPSIHGVQFGGCRSRSECIEWKARD
jgi:hypothetical protein